MARFSGWLPQEPVRCEENAPGKKRVRTSSRISQVRYDDVVFANASYKSTGILPLLFDRGAADRRGGGETRRRWDAAAV
jgi:hypothetical protein